MPDTLPLEKILGYVPITGLMMETTTGLPDPLPPAFKARRKDITGDTARLMVRRGQRKTARRAEYGAPPLSRELVKIGYKDAKLIHFHEEQAVDPNVLLKLRDTTSYTNQRHGRDELDEQTKQFAQLFVNTEIVARQQVLARGHLYFDSDGWILPNSSGAFLDVDYGVAASHQNQLGGIISASWADPDTDIPSQVIALKKQAVRETGKELKYALYMETVVSYLFNNTFMQAYLARHPVLREQWLSSGEIPDGVLGLTWAPVYNGFFEDENGTNRDCWPTDSVTFTPDPGESEDWWRMYYGSILVPRSLDVTGPGMATLDNCDERFGMFGYGHVEHKPMRVVTVHGHTFLPALENADAIYQAVVAF